MADYLVVASVDYLAVVMAACLAENWVVTLAVLMVDNSAAYLVDCLAEL